LRLQQALEDLQANAGIKRAQALNDIASYAKAVRDAQYQLENYTPPPYLQGLDTIEALNQMKDRLAAASAAFQPYRFADAGDATRRARLQDLNDAQSQYDAAIKNLNLQYDLQVAQARLDKALADYAEYTSGPPADDLTLAQSELADAQAQLEAARSDLEKAIANASLVSPVDGIVLSIEAAPGALVSASPVMTLLDVSQMEFHTTNLSERDLALIAPGQKALVILKAYPDDPIEASVVRIGWQAGAAVGDAATFPIVLALSQTNLDIRPGMTGRVELRTEK
jgi:multidrug resistance efflux pump